MAYLNKITKVKNKPCSCPELPNIEKENLDALTRWQCDICGKIWQTGYDMNHFPFEELVWRDVSGKQNRS